MASRREGKHSTALARLTEEQEDHQAWLEAYEKAPTTTERVSLLHRGFVRGFRPIPAIAFYLKEADGHVEHDDSFFIMDDETNSFSESVNSQHRASIAEPRRKVAQKAFDVLVSELFKDTREKHQATPSWLPLVTNTATLDALVHFFRIDENSRFVNLNRDVPEHRRLITYEFLFTLARYGWEESPTHDRCESSEIAGLFKSYRVQFMDVLCGLGKLDHLLHFSCRRDNDVGELELRKLEALALGQEYFFHDTIHSHASHRKAASIEEAAYEGSQAAKVAILLRERLKVHQRFEAKKAAERQIRDARRLLEQVSAQTT